MTCALIGILAANLAAAALPDAPCPGWKATSERVVTPATIFDYMNGAGELYLAYGVKQITVRQYSCEGQLQITCEVYEMPTAADAFGVWSQDQTGQKLQIGQGALYSSGLLIAWRGRLFVRLLADRETQSARECMTALAKAALGAEPDGALPGVLDKLPKPGLDTSSIHFFRTDTCLKYLYFISTENLLNLSPKTEAVLATYTGASRLRSLVLVVTYPSADDARKAWKSYVSKYLKGLKPIAPYSLAKLENKNWTAGLVSGRDLVIVLESPSREQCIVRLQALEKHIRQINKKG